MLYEYTCSTHARACVREGIYMPPTSPYRQQCSNITVAHDVSCASPPPKMKISVLNVHVGHSATSSSSSRLFQLSGKHRLTEIRSDISGAVELSELDLTQLRNVIPLYNLEDLFTKVNFTNPEHFSKHIKASAKLDHGCHPIAWVSSLQPVVSQNLTFMADVEVRSLAEGLVAFRSSLNNRPDGVVLRAFQHCGKEWKLPLFIIEVHSGIYKNSVAKAAMDVLDQLRLLRCFDQNIVQCIGFTFPKYPQGSSNNKTCVTKVVVSFESFRFIVRMFPLNISSVQSEVEVALKNALEFKAAPDPQFCFLRLSDSEMGILRDTLNVQHLIQCPTKHSMLFKADETFWKYSPHENEVQYLKFNISNPRHIVLFSQQIWLPSMLFLSFPAQLPPLSRNEVSTCLVDFMVRTALALQELHEYGFAHLDVRIPNICFSKEKNLDGEYDVKLIDLDRSTSISTKSMESYPGQMYRKSQRSWTIDKLDWKQLGLLAARIVTKYKMTDENIVSSDLVLGDQCLTELIQEGTLMYKPIVLCCAYM